MQQKIHGNVIWIDEAGMLGTKDMVKLCDLVNSLDARLVLTGDVRQHRSISRGATLRLLEDEAGLAPAELKEIQRQAGKYKKAVEAMSEGRVADGFRQLDELGWIHETKSADRYKLLADEYVKSVSKCQSAPGQSHLKRREFR